MEERRNIWRKVSPVSYTHLDVYKRQTFKSEENPFLPRREENSKKNSQEHSSQETEDTSFVTGGEKSDAASQQIFDIAKQDQTLAAEDVNIDERLSLIHI